MATAFHGGGGCHKDVVSENIEDLRHPVYADSDPTTSKMRNMGSVCGALNAGVMLIGYLFGRSRPGEDITCPSELAYELHNRFEETLGSKICSMLKPFHVKTSADPARLTRRVVAWPILASRPAQATIGDGATARPLADWL